MSSTPLRLALYTPQALNLPSQRIRLIEPLSYLRTPINVVVCSGFTAQGQYVVNDGGWQDCDVVIVQRNFPTAQTIDLVRRIAASGKRIIYETDDAFQAIALDHPKAFHRHNAPYIEECARLAHTVVVSTEPLARFYADCSRVVVARNQLSPRLWSPNVVPPARVDSDQVCIALVGGNDHLDDFLLIREPLAALVCNPSVKWAGYGEGALKFLAALGAKNPVQVPPNYDYASHPGRLAALGADIALCPLQDSEFNRCKSDIKAIEFGWLGIPCVVSDLAPYALTVTHEVRGLRCRDSSSWLAAMSRLVEDADFRHRLGQAAQEYVHRERMISVENNPWNQILYG
ncbi:MAG: hypothetical protein ACOY41_08480 [Pseudomonadota bacterium]